MRKESSIWPTFCIDQAELKLAQQFALNEAEKRGAGYAASQLLN